MKKYLSFVWQLPQNILALFVKAFTRAKKQELHDYTVDCWKHCSGLSLGNHIFVNKYASEDTVKHEHGHQIQSLYLGWFYLIVIGLPSLLWVSVRRIGFFKKKSYYWFYTEKWANKLVGLE